MAVAAALIAAACAPPRPDDSARIRIARQAHDGLRAQLAPLLDADPVVQAAQATPGEIVLGVHPDLVTAMLKAVGRRYLDEVALDLPLDRVVETSRDVHVDTPFGRVRAGGWTAKITIRRVQGTLVTDEPQVVLGSAGEVSFATRVGVRDGRGRAAVDFAWNGRSVAGVVCRDFTLHRELEGTLAPRSYPVEGSYRLSAQGERVIARPHFEKRTFHIQPSLTSASWQLVADALAEQDRVTRCGLGLDPADVRARLERLLEKGFEVPLPSTLLHAVDLPAQVGHEAEVDGRPVAVAAGARALRVGPDGVWLGVGVAPSRGDAP